jgi:uncharacterized protein YggE
MALAATALGACAPAAAQQPVPPPGPTTTVVGATPVPQIVTSGQGETKVAPDRATLEISVQTRATTAAEAGTQNARRQQAVLDALRKLGFASEQLSTSGYNLYPEMTYDRNGGRPRVVAYNATNTVRVDIRDIGMIGRAIDASLEAGANMISSLSFYSSTIENVRREALTRAVADARADAEAIARAAGGTLGGLLEIASMQMGYQPPMPMLQASRAMEKDAANTPIEPGQQTINAVVTARWAFVPNR